MLTPVMEADRGTLAPYLAAEFAGATVSVADGTIQIMAVPVCALLVTFTAVAVTVLGRSVIVPGATKVYWPCVNPDEILPRSGESVQVTETPLSFASVVERTTLCPGVTRELPGATATPLAAGL